MKKFYMLMVAMLCGAAAVAQNELYVPEITVKPGTTGTLEICLRNTDPIVGLAFKISTVTGIKFTTKATDFSFVESRLDVEKAKENAKLNAKKEAADDEEYQDLCDEIDDMEAGDLFERSKSGVFIFQPGQAALVAQNEAGQLQWCAFAGNDGAILTVPVTVAADVEEKTYDLSLTQVQVNSPDASDVVQNLSKDAPTVNFTLKVGDPTGINSINAEDSKAPVYNLAGQRVSKAQQGVFIQNGKKVAVK
jgi:hypothetical protein